MISRQPPEAPLRASMLSASIAAVAASLLSLPLESPHDGLVNTASIVVITLIAGVVAGIAWKLIPEGPHRTARFYALVLLGFAIVAGTTALAQTQIERAVSFGLPVAAVAAVIIGGGVPLLADKGRALPWWLATAAVAVALAIGVGLAGQGDQESGDLELPPRAARLGG
ncbi:MAG: hypothetical protein OXN15_00410 [Chloroflexota bacterium]|nr:hypothetical protein [Chloroflexota bacterium]MDE2969346.1 hypothetical protein [Chloroflexota bacterium]